MMKEDKKLLIYKIIIILLGFSSLCLLYTQKIYIYEKISIKTFSVGMIIGIILWIIFLINATILVFIVNKNDEKYLKLRNIQRNIVLLLLITMILIYRVGNGILTLYKLKGTSFRIMIYVIFGLIFLTYIIMTIVINKQEVNNSKKKKLKNKK